MRERFDLLVGRFRQQSKEEAKACGVSPEQTELDAVLEEISERQTLAESTRKSCSSKNVETDRKKAEEIRIYVPRPWKELVQQKKGQMKIVKENLEGGVEVELMLQNFYEKNQKRSLRFGGEADTDVSKPGG